MKSFRLVLIIFASFVFINAQTADELVEKLQNKFLMIEDLSADFKQQTQRNSEAGGFSLKGKFVFCKENNFKLKFGNQEIISNGKTIWNYNKGMERVVISNNEDEPNAFSIKNFVMDYPAKSKLQLIGTNTIKMTPKSEDLLFSWVEISFDKNFVINKIVIEDLSETKYIVDLYNLSLNNKIDKEVFNFNPPEGIQIVDLR